MASNASTIQILENTTELERMLEELDRVIHRSRALLHGVRSGAKGMSLEKRKAWESLAGLWKGRITEDPLAYQRRVRAEEEV